MNETTQASAAPFKLETLEHISFKRSKTWGNFFNRFTQNQEDGKNEDELDLEKLDVVFKNDVEKEDQNSINEAEEIDVFDDDDILQDITNHTTTQLQSKTLLGNSQNMLVRYDFTRVVEEEEQETQENDDEIMQDILNQTRPLLREQKRKWKEAGIERILNTFDPVKIDEKVGGWLRRNYSSDAICDDTALEIYCRNSRGKDAKTHGSCRERTQTLLGSESESDSLHSIDTARYIRSSRKRNKHLSSSYCTTTMTIKTFRMVKSKREELRRKYACAEHNEAELHLNKLRNRRAHAQHQQKHNHCHMHQSHSAPQTSSAVKKKTVVSQRQRSKKQALKKRSASNSSSTSSCASVERRQARCMHTCACFHCSSMCSSFSSYSSSCSALHCNMSRQHHKNSERKIKQQTVSFQLPKDARPWKRESECRCCNDDKLCKLTRHLADSSTDEWMVENCDSPKKTIPLKRNTYDAETESDSIQRHANKATAKLVKLKESLRTIISESSDEEDIRLEKPKIKRIDKKMVIASSDSDRDTGEIMMAQSRKRDERSKQNINNTKQVINANKMLQKVQQTNKNYTGVEHFCNGEYDKDKLKKTLRTFIPESSDEEDIKLENTKIKPKVKKIVIVSSDSDRDSREIMMAQNRKREERPKQNINNTKQVISANKMLQKVQQTNKSCTGVEHFCNGEYDRDKLNDSPRTITLESSDDDIKPEKSQIKSKYDEINKAIQSSEPESLVNEKMVGQYKKQRGRKKIDKTKQVVKETEKLQKVRETNKEYDDDDDFNKQLQLALEESRKTHEKEQEQLKLKLKQDAISNKPITKQQPSVEERKILERRKRQQSADDKQRCLEEDYIVPLKKNNMLPVKTNKAKLLKLQKLAKHNQEPTPEHVSEATFFSNDINIYNSTALANDTATARQFSNSNNSAINDAMPPEKTATVETVIAKSCTQATPHKSKSRSVKRAAAVSTTKRLANASTASSSTSSLGSTNAGFANLNVLAAQSIVKPQQQLPKTKAANENDPDSDCARVSSTTGTGSSANNNNNSIIKIAEVLPAPPTLSKQNYETTKGILIYAPHNRTLTPAQCFNNGFFNVTLEHLSAVIGAKAAQKFFKYYRGQRRFDINSTIYFRPAKSSAATSIATDDSSDSDDELNAMFDCGDLHVSAPKANATEID